MAYLIDTKVYTYIDFTIDKKNSKFEIQKNINSLI